MVAGLVIRRRARPRRGARDPPRRAGPRRRLRQRQRGDRRGAAAWGDTVGADFVPALLERGRERAAAERLEVEFVEADAQDLPFEDASFDVAMSIFGAMFAPDQQQDRAGAAARRASPAAGSGWPTGPPTAPSARCS